MSSQITSREEAVDGVCAAPKMLELDAPHPNANLRCSACAVLHDISQLLETGLDRCDPSRGLSQWEFGRYM
eukprot:6187381-Pleurochrysis_carterae.AAC.5